MGDYICFACLFPEEPTFEHKCWVNSEVLD